MNNGFIILCSGEYKHDISLYASDPGSLPLSVQDTAFINKSSSTKPFFVQAEKTHMNQRMNAN